MPRHIRAGPPTSLSSAEMQSPVAGRGDEAMERFHDNVSALRASVRERVAASDKRAYSILARPQGYPYISVKCVSGAECRFVVRAKIAEDPEGKVRL